MFFKRSSTDTPRTSVKLRRPVHRLSAMEHRQLIEDAARRVEVRRARKTVGDAARQRLIDALGEKAPQP